MKKLATLFLGISLLTSLTLAKEPLRSQDSIVVEKGRVVETGLLADDKGFIFLEFLKGASIKKQETKLIFEGEILPPEIIPLPEKAPRARMREILSFELYADSNEDLLFTDRFAGLTQKGTLREELLNPESFERSHGIKLLVALNEEDEVIDPALWQFANSEWKKVGGTLEDSEEEGVMIFSAQMMESGVFTIFDENPLPSFAPNFPIDEIELVEESPFPSVETPSSAEESSEEVISDNELFGDETENFEALEEKASPEIPAIPEDTEVTEVPALEETAVNTKDLFEGEDALTSGIEGTEDLALLEEGNTLDIELAEGPSNENLQSSSPEIPEGELPSTGEEERNVPLFLVLALLILGMSVYLGVSKKSPL